MVTILRLALQEIIIFFNFIINFVKIWFLGILDNCILCPNCLAIFVRNHVMRLPLNLDALVMGFSNLSWVFWILKFFVKWVWCDCLSLKFKSHFVFIYILFYSNYLVEILIMELCSAIQGIIIFLFFLSILSILESFYFLLNFFCKSLLKIM